MDGEVRGVVLLCFGDGGCLGVGPGLWFRCF